MLAFPIPWGSRANGPVLNRHFPHRKVIDVRRGERSSNPFRCCRDQAIRLVQGHTLLCERPTPSTRLNALCGTERRQAQCIEQTTGSSLLTRPQTSPNLLDR